MLEDTFGSHVCWLEVVSLTVALQFIQQGVAEFMVVSLTVATLHDVHNIQGTSRAVCFNVATKPCTVFIFRQELSLEDDVGLY
jgi:hypothetical protein